MFHCVQHDNRGAVILSEVKDRRRWKMMLQIVQHDNHSAVILSEAKDPKCAKKMLHFVQHDNGVQHDNRSAGQSGLNSSTNVVEF